ncbi:hypothetical protein [Carboxydothermus pertinax]|uniref:hypothetical protein n=1 Tax=Carboxydothermus pertinax TaxID=870242 RepID=UPI000ADFB291|nr:hypothetical protein [Carboxydothermus pertinax]
MLKIKNLRTPMLIFSRKNLKTKLLLSIMALNFSLLGVDVAMAHSQNNFFRWEIIPLIYCPLAVLATLGRLFFLDKLWSKRIFKVSMWLGVAVGVIGTFFHLTGNASSHWEPLYKIVVDGSPVAAPIAFAGVSLFALVSEGTVGLERRSKLLTLVGYGFLGAVLAAFFDHARLNFEPVYTIIPLITGIMAIFSCLWLAKRSPDRGEEYFFLAVLALNLFAGLLGFVFHVLGDLAGTQGIVFARFLYRNPLLGPLLFCNLALLGGLSIIPEPVEPMLEWQKEILKKSKEELLPIR